MATYDSVRLATEDLKRTLTLYNENIVIISENTLLEAGDAAAQAMAQTILAAVTPTGEARAAAGQGVPGRFKTGAMYDSIYDDKFDENAGAAHVLTTSGGNVQLRVGFLNSPAYTKYQELSGPGNNDAIAPMMAIQAGFLAARAVVFQELIAAARVAGDDAKAGRLSRRGRAGL